MKVIIVLMSVLAGFFSPPTFAQEAEFKQTTMSALSAFDYDTQKHYELLLRTTYIHALDMSSEPVVRDQSGNIARFARNVDLHATVSGSLTVADMVSRKIVVNKNIQKQIQDLLVHPLFSRFLTNHGVQTVSPERFMGAIAAKDLTAIDGRLDGECEEVFWEVLKYDGASSDSKQ